MYTAEYNIETAAILATIATRMDSSQNCPRELDFNPSCTYDGCRQCSNFCIMLNGVGPRATVGITGQQLLNQLPHIDGTVIRSARYGHASFSDLDRTKINHNYGKFFICRYIISLTLVKS